MRLGSLYLFVGTFAYLAFFPSQENFLGGT